MSGNFDGKKFHNLNKKARPFGLLGTLQWMLSRSKGYWPKEILNTYHDLPPAIVEGDDLKVTFIGHATFLLQTGGINIITDPVFSERASPVSWAGPKRVRKPGLDLSELPKIDIILVSHGHYDHLDIESLRQIYGQNKEVRIFTPLGNEKDILRALPHVHVSSLDWYQSYPTLNGLEICLEPAQHWSARGLWDQNRALWGTFIINTPSGSICFIGDTGYDSRMFKDIGEKYPKIKLSLIPIGCYEPRWFMKYVHVNPHEAVMIHQDLYSQLSIASHFGTFRLTDEGCTEPVHALEEACRALGVRKGAFITLDVGQCLNVNLSKKKHESLDKLQH